MQAHKEDAQQSLIADYLLPYTPSRRVADVCIVGCGPAGLALAGELATQGIDVALVGERLLSTATAQHTRYTLCRPSRRCTMQVAISPL